VRRVPAAERASAATTAAAEAAAALLLRVRVWVRVRVRVRVRVKVLQGKLLGLGFRVEVHLSSANTLFTSE
jgi:hypothetical protein